MAKNVIVRNNENTPIICSEVDTIILPTTNGGTAVFKDWNGIDKGSNISTSMHCKNIILDPFEKIQPPIIKTDTALIISNFTVEDVSGATYNFTLNNQGYYESTNKGVHSSYALCKVSFETDGTQDVLFTCISSGENNLDYGVLSTLDKSLALSIDDSSNVYKSFKGLSSTSPQYVTYTAPSAGKHYIYVKFRKDGSVNNGNDSLQFIVTIF